MSAKLKIIALLLILGLSYFTYECLREPTPEEIIADAFSNSDDILEAVEAFSRKEMSRDEIIAEIQSNTKDLEEILIIWHSLSTAVSDDEAAEMLGKRNKRLRIKSSISKAAALYEKLKKIYHNDEAFRAACEQYYKSVIKFPGLKQNLHS